MWNSVVTNAGIALLAQWAQGGTLAITGATSGTGTVPVAQLMAQTAMTGDTHALSITGQTSVAQGIKLQVQLHAAEAAYTAMQIGIWASLDGGSNTLLAIYQADNDSGIAVPSVSDMPDFALRFSATVQMDNTGELNVTIDPTALVSQAQLTAGLAAKLDTANLYNALDQSAAGYALDARQGAALKAAVDAKVALVVDCGTITALPKTVTNAAITSDMVVVESVVGTPSAMGSDWTVTTANGSLTISGTISGSSTLVLTLMHG